MYLYCIRVCVSWIVGIVLKTTLQLGQLREKRKIRNVIQTEDVLARSVQQQQQEEDRKMLVENMLSARTSAHSESR